MLYVDPAGDDSCPGSIEQPFATIDRAREAATPGSVVNLRAGTYYRTEPFLLTAAHSGVVYQAYGYGTTAQEDVVISGGRVVTGWQAGTDGALEAEVSGPPIRQLSVAGRRAERAAIPIEHTLTRTETGYLIDDPRPARWRGEVEFVYRGAYPWSEGRCAVAELAGDEHSSTVTMAQPAFDWATRLYRAALAWVPGEVNGADSPTSVENSPDFLTEGTFACGDGLLHYLPQAGESLDEVVAPTLETLLYARDLHDVSFRGITFADATWQRPGTPEGFVH